MQVELETAISEATKKLRVAGLNDLADSLAAAWQHLIAPAGKWTSQYSAQLIKCDSCEQAFPSRAALHSHVQRELKVAAFTCYGHCICLHQHIECI
jgi:hypothetical protein